MTDTTPLPCPFCGGDKVLISQTLDQAKPNWFAACHRATCAFTGYSLTEADALTAWNTRANADARLVEALRAVDALLHEHGYEPEGTMRHTIRAALSEVSHG